MKTLLLVLALVFASDAAPRPRRSFFKDLHRDPYVLGGVEAEIGEFPHQLSLMVNNGDYHTCGAVLISPLAALTAAHCVAPNAPGNYRVRVGQHIKDEFEAEHDIESIDQYEDYSLITWEGDLALLHLATEVDESSDLVGSIRIASPEDDLVGDGCVLSGWGGAEDGVQQNLRRADTPILTTQECRERMIECDCNAWIFETQICGYDGTTAACSGDSGGPTTCLGTTVNGIVSWGIGGAGGACVGDWPSVHTRVSSYEDWIRERVPGLP